jgi:hypothetical protein
MRQRTREILGDGFGEASGGDGYHWSGRVSRSGESTPNQMAAAGMSTNRRSAKAAKTTGDLELRDDRDGGDASGSSRGRAPAFVRLAGVSWCG